MLIHTCEHVPIFILLNLGVPKSNSIKIQTMYIILKLHTIYIDDI